jgi:hypothetical protein
LLIGVLTIVGADARALSLAYDIGGTGRTAGSSTHVLGWEFDVTSPTTVIGLGFWDEGSDGIAGTDVGIWDRFGTLLVSASVSSSDPLVTSAHAAGDWRVRSVADVLLPVGIGYVIGAVMNGDTFRVDGSQGLTHATIAGINYIHDRFTSSSNLVFPTGYTNLPTILPGYAGPTFFVPEPTTALLLTGGLLGFLAAARRRRSPH